jgi:soluble lytic murein transglycosylase-like protein
MISGDSHKKERINTCTQIGAASIEAGEDPALLIAMAWHESRFRNVSSGKGALGPLQVIPGYWCPGGDAADCNLIQAGVTALQTYKGRYNALEEVLCHYNAGNTCYSSSYTYARKIIHLAKQLNANYSLDKALYNYK